MIALYHQVAYSSPFLILVLWAVVASICLWWNGAGSRRYLLWLVLPVALLAMLSTPLAAHLALGSLEWRYPPQEQRPRACPVIVVLGGGMRPPDDLRGKAEPSPDTMVRCLHAAAQYHQAQPCPILVSGGKVRADRPGPALAQVMRELLIRLGVAAEHIWLEDKSRSTYENAVECRKQLARRGIDRLVLVTSCVHMARAERCFRRQGLTVTPSVCYRRSTELFLGIETFLPSPVAAFQVQEAYHEWIGMLWYAVRGRI